jgi:flagellar basal body-associated protein FliL
MADNDKKFSGNELDDNIPDGVRGKGNDPSQVPPVETSGKKSFLAKWTAVLIAALCLCVTSLISLTTWYVFSKKASQKAVAIEAQKQEDSLLKMDSFVIPYNGDNYTYVSFDVSLRVPGGSMRDEITDKMGLIRGRIYELMLTYLDQSGEVLSPESVKGLIVESISSSLSEGEINDLFLTQFLFI